MKNRVAAQTSRDRKKARLDELEDTVQSLKEANDFLTQECALLRAQNETLMVESKRTRINNRVDNLTTEERYCTMCQGRVGCVGPALGSAVSPFNPLPQGGTTQRASSRTPTASAEILLKILTLYLLWKNSSATSKAMVTLNDSKSLQKAFCERLPLKWKRALRDHVKR